MTNISALSRDAAQAAKKLALLNSEEKNRILLAMSLALKSAKGEIQAANRLDLQDAKANNLPDAMIDRLTLTDERIDAMAQGVEEIASLPDPVGQLRDFGTRPNGIVIRKMRVPLGVICMIYEARPNVTADAGALCFKSGNGVILRGGKEALQSSLAIAKVLHQVLRSYGLPESLITVVPDPNRGLLMELMQQRDYIDLVIPRGGEGLIEFVTEHSSIPVIQHFKGVCHLFVDEEADLDIALNLAINGKTQRTGVCNALEGILVHKDIAEVFLTRLSNEFAVRQVKINADAQSAVFFDGANILSESDFGQEYLSLEVAIKTVDSMEEALEHIDRFGSHHTEVICTANLQRAELFQRSVDASVVMVNASSRFSDGGELGLGAEIGIATTKLHAYGPMGLESLTTEKYLVDGTGQVRA